MSGAPIVANCLTEVIYMSSFGPGSSRHVSIPSHGLRISDSGAIDAWNGRYMCGQIVQLRELEASEVTELDRLNTARAEFEKARLAYEEAKRTFMASTAGLKLSEYLHPPWTPSGPPDTTDLMAELTRLGVEAAIHVKKSSHGMDLYNVLVVCDSSTALTDEVNKVLSGPLITGKYKFRYKRESIYHYECGTEYEAYRETDLELLKLGKKYDGPLLTAFNAQRAVLGAGHEPDSADDELDESDD